MNMIITPEFNHQYACVLVIYCICLTDFFISLQISLLKIEIILLVVILFFLVFRTYLATFLLQYEPKRLSQT